MIYTHMPGMTLWAIPRFRRHEGPTRADLKSDFQLTGDEKGERDYKLLKALEHQSARQADRFNNSAEPL